jgi:hypothetical protein
VQLWREEVKIKEESNDEEMKRREGNAKGGRNIFFYGNFYIMLEVG